jgi:RNA polymerase sigma-70 factor (ECF subfamily)
MGADADAVLVALYPRLRRFAAVVGDLDSDPDDLVQEAFARVLTRADLATLDDPLAYLRRVVLNLVRNQRRHAAAGRRAAARFGTADESAVASYPSDLTELLRIDPRSRALLYLTELEGASIAEAAAIVGCTETAARMQLSRARRRLRALIEEEESGDDARTH